MSLRVAELETLFTANIKGFEQGADKVETRSKAVGKKPVQVAVDADVMPALAGMDRVEAAGKKLVSAKTALEVDAAIDKAQKNIDKVELDLRVLARTESSPEVKVEIDKARAEMIKAEARLDALNGMRAEMIVEADTGQAEEALDDVADQAEDAGEDGGRRGGKGLVVGIVAALATIPIAGAIVGIAKSAADAVVQGFQDGLAVEVRSDRLAAMTGLDDATVRRLGTAAGDAYAQNFGESIASNMDTARIAVQSRLLDPQSTQRDAQQMVQSLSGVADVLGEDIPRVARSTAQLLRTGLAKDSAQAFDIIVKGQQAGLNVSEDWLDTLDEYSTQFRKLGLDSSQVLGLLSQGVRAGARDTDVAADALKEFSIRAIDGSKLTAEGFTAIGLSATDMAARIAQGGPEAAAALEETLTKLREVEDPTARAAAAVALFGTQAEDMGEALYALDLSTAVQELGSVEGAAKRALDTLGDNTAGKVESAQRNIEVAADGIKGALAEAFSPQIEGFAGFVSENREAVIGFLLDAANGALDFAEAVVEAAATGTEALGDFASETVGGVIDAIANMAVAVDHAMPGDQHAADFREWADGAIADLERFDKGTETTADQIRTQLIDNALNPAREKLNTLGDGMLTNAALSDATTRLANDVAAVGYAADGSKVSIDLLDGSFNTSTASGQMLDEQVRAVRDSLDQQVLAAERNGESQDDLRARVDDARQAFKDQMVAMGLTEDQANALADQYGLIQPEVDTRVRLLGAEEARSAAQSVYDKIAALPTAKYITVGVIDNYSRTAASIYSASGGRKATGGPITGGVPGVDSVPILAMPGEHMLTVQDVAALGGHAGVYALRSALHSGGKIPGALLTQVPGMAGGGQVGGPVATPVRGAPVNSNARGATYVFNTYTTDSRVAVREIAEFMRE